MADCVNVCLLIGKVRVPCVRFGRPFRNASYGTGACVNREEGAFGTNSLFSALALSFFTHWLTNVGACAVFVDALIASQLVSRRTSPFGG